MALLQLPPMPGVPEPLAGRFTITVRYVYVGNANDGATWLTPIRSAAPALLDAVGLIPASMMGLVHSDPEDPMPVSEASSLLTDFNEAGVDAMLEAAGPDANSPQMLVEIRQFGGALALAPDVPSAFYHRDATFGLYSVGAGSPPELPGMAAHSARMQADMSPWAHGATGTLPNFSGGGGHAGFAANYTAPVLAQLTALAGQYDPENVFRLRQVPEP